MTDKLTIGRLKAAVRREAYKLTRNHVDSQILAELWAWTPYARVKRDGKTWIVKTDSDLIEGDGVAAAPRTVRESLRRLRARALIESTRGPHPSGRLANSRYVRLSEGLFEELKASAQNGRRSRNACRMETDSNASSTRDEVPAQPGTNGRLHRQSTSNEQINRTDKKEQRADSVRRKEKYNRGEDERITEELVEVQRRFSEGCGGNAAALDDPRRISALKRFLAACLGAELSHADAAEAAFLFAKHYSQEAFAQHLGRDVSRVSPNANHFVLGMAAEIAIALFRQVPNAFVQMYGFEFDCGDEFLKAAARKGDS